MSRIHLIELWLVRLFNRSLKTMCTSLQKLLIHAGGFSNLWVFEGLSVSRPFLLLFTAEAILDCVAIVSGLILPPSRLHESTFFSLFLSAFLFPATGMEIAPIVSGLPVLIVVGVCFLGTSRDQMIPFVQILFSEALGILLTPVVGTVLCSTRLQLQG